MDVDDFKWNDQYVDIKLAGARIIALLNDGGTIVEDNLPLMFSEGRSQASMYMGEKEGFLESLDYMCQFAVDGGPDWEASSWAEARIVIVGTHRAASSLRSRVTAIWAITIREPRGQLSRTTRDPSPARQVAGRKTEGGGDQDAARSDRSEAAGGRQDQALTGAAVAHPGLIDQGR